jgi:hypothetical protein
MFDMDPLRFAPAIIFDYFPRARFSRTDFTGNASAAKSAANRSVIKPTERALSKFRRRRH